MGLAGLYYMCPLGLVMRAAVPAALKSGGLSVQEAVDGSYSPPQETFVALHPSVRNEADLHAALDSLSRARGQYRAMTEYLERTGPPNFDDPKFVPRRLLTASPAVLRALTDKCLLRSVRREAVGKEGDAVRFRLPELTPAQQRCFERIGELFAGKDVVLLHGVTGSGKTEIYIRLIAEELRAGRNVLYMLPEIALTAQLIGRMRDHFGDAVIVYHSRLTDNRRADVYRRLIGGSGGRLVVGVRSSVLLPLPLLSLVIVDEEHENSFKQADSAPRYHGRDPAVMLAALCGAKTLLGSATPSVESYFNAATGKYGLVTLAERYGGAVLPRVIVSDTLRAAKRGEKRSHFNKVLLDRIGEALQAGSQAILFQNRRGFSPYVECGHCGWTANCPDCNVSLTYHKSDGSLRCHYCGYRIPVPAVCPSCGTGSLLPRGFGTEKIEQELAAIFPEAAIDRLDADTSQSAGGYRRIVEAFEQGRTDILIGTQIVTKGFDFGGVSLVGILNADNLLNYPDFRAGERAFQLMTQVGGRAGRRSEPGTVVIQTAHPQHPVIEQVLRGDYRGDGPIAAGRAACLFLSSLLPPDRRRDATPRQGAAMAGRRGVRRLGSRGVRPPAAGSRGSARGPYPGPLPGSFPAENRAPEPVGRGQAAATGAFRPVACPDQSSGASRSRPMSIRCNALAAGRPVLPRRSVRTERCLRSGAGMFAESGFPDRMSGREAHGS